MILGELLQRIQTGYSRGVQAASSRLENRFIYSIFITVRSRLLAQKANKKQHISLWNYQIIPCIEFQKVPKHQCPCIPPLGCYIWRSKHPIPEVLSDLNHHLFQYVGNLTNDGRIDPIKVSQVKNLNGDKYTSGSLRYFIEGGYMWLVGTETDVIPVLRGAALFQDPLEADAFQGYCEDKDQGCEDCNQCKSALEIDFDISNAEIDALIALTITEIQAWFMSNVEDKMADGSEQAVISSSRGSSQSE